MSFHQYIQDRNKAMLMYPDTKGLDDLVKKYPEYFDDRFRRSWDFIGETNPSAKLRTLEKMILTIDDVPFELKEKVRMNRVCDAIVDAVAKGAVLISELRCELESDNKDDSGLLDE